jgi:NAD(P)-dependent dehydrogenase (short-subunit alcohol dehydrogenase family)
MGFLMGKDKVVLVTGSSGAIGAAICKALTQSGYTAIGLDKTDPNYPMLDGQTHIACDLEEIIASPAAFKRLADQIKACVGQNSLVGLVNNAAVQILGDAETLSVDEISKTFDVNVKSAFALSNLCFAQLERHGGCIVNISSIHARLSKPKFVAYATSKAALSALTRYLALEWGGRVRVNGIEPAAVETNMLLTGFNGDAAIIDQLKAISPSGHIAQPDHIGKSVVNFFDDTNIHHTGVLLQLDGGLSGALSDV